MKALGAVILALLVPITAVNTYYAVVDTSSLAVFATAIGFCSIGMVVVSLVRSDD